MPWGSPERRFLRFRRRGDAEALARVFDATAPEVLRVAMHLARDPVEAEDLLQRTFLTAIERAATYDPAQRLVPWLLGILANHAREAARKERRTFDPQRLRVPTSADPVEQAEQREALAGLEHALEGLTDPCRSTVILHFRHGLAPAEIAAALGLAPATVRSHLHRGVERLRRATAPAWLAGALVAVPPLRGLEAIRCVVVAHAEAAAPALAATAAGAAGAAVLTGGALVSKKLLIAAAATVLLFGGGAAWWTHARRNTADFANRALVVGAGDTSVDARPSLVAPERESEGANRPAPPAARSGHGDLHVAVRWPDGTAAAGISLLALVGGDVQTGEMRRAVTDASGAARLLLLPSGRVLVRADRGAGTYAVVPDGGTASVELALAAGTSLQGEVVDEAGVAVRGAAVWLCADTWRQLASHAATTDAEGRFSLPHVGFGYVWARAPGHAPSSARRIAGREGDVERIRLALRGPGGRVSGAWWTRKAGRSPALASSSARAWAGSR